MKMGSNDLDDLHGPDLKYQHLVTFLLLVFLFATHILSLPNVLPLWTKVWSDNRRPCSLRLHKGGLKMNATDAHVIRNILIQMLVNTRTPEPMVGRRAGGKPQDSVKNLATYLKSS
jgi:hypothetical protein